MKLWKMLQAAPLGAALTAALAAAPLAAGVLFLPDCAHAQAATLPQPNAIKSFQAIEDKWSAAVVNPDQYTMDLLLGPSFMDITASGDVETRDQYIAFLFAKGEVKPYSMLQSVTSVRRFGDTAVVNGTYEIKIPVDGISEEEQGVFTHVFEKTPAGWRCVNAQRTNIPVQKAVGAARKKHHRF